MASEPADVLIIGAGASGGVVALRLAEAGFKVTCLEQGDWHNRADYPGNKLDWELQGPQALGDEPEHPRPRQRLPDRRGRHPRLAAHVQRASAARRSSSPAPGRATLPSDFRVRSLDGIADDWPIDYYELLPVLLPDRPPVRRISGLPGDPAYPPDAEDAADAAAADRRRRAQGRAGHHQARLALVAGVQLDQLDRRTTAAGRASSASTCQ